MFLVSSHLILYCSYISYSLIIHEELALFWSHDDTGYLVKYFDPVPGLDQNYFKSKDWIKIISSPRTGSKLFQVQGLDQNYFKS